MRRKLIIPSMIVFVIIACTIFMNDGLTYLITSLMGLAIAGTVLRNRSGVMKMTRWAKANPRKTQWLITGLHAVLLALGIIAGYELRKSGYEFSGITAFVFSTLIVIGFLSVPFLPKRSRISVPKDVNRNRFVFMGIALSSFVLMAFLGNRIEDLYPNSPLTRTVRAIDHAIFPDQSIPYSDIEDEAFVPAHRKNYDMSLNANSSPAAVFAVFTVYGKETVTPPDELKKETKTKPGTEKKLKKQEKKKARMMNRIRKLRLGLAAGISVGAILLIILLGILTCAGICLIIAGIGGSGAGYIPLGALVAGGSIWGIIKLSKGGKEKNNKE